MIIVKLLIIEIHIVLLGTKQVKKNGCLYIRAIFVAFAVLDMNDNPPKFEQPSYTCFLSEHAQRGQFVTVVSASDADYVDQERLVYTIVGGNEQQTFTIDPTTGNPHSKLQNVMGVYRFFKNLILNLELLRMRCLKCRKFHSEDP
jgi:Na+-transporting methylmalonyl-CoA/oxaloacetate decarboxylase beta subunit